MTYQSDGPIDEVSVDFSTEGRKGAKRLVGFTTANPYITIWRRILLHRLTQPLEIAPPTPPTREFIGKDITLLCFLPNRRRRGEWGICGTSIRLRSRLSQQASSVRARRRLIPNITWSHDPLSDDALHNASARLVVWTRSRNV